MKNEEKKKGNVIWKLLKSCKNELKFGIKVCINNLDIAAMLLTKIAKSPTFEEILKQFSIFFFSNLL